MLCMRFGSNVYHLHQWCDLERGLKSEDSRASNKSLIIVNDKCFIAIYIVLYSHFVILDFCFVFFRVCVCFVVSVSASDMRLWMSISIFCIILKCIWSDIDGAIISYSLNRRCRSSNNIKFVFDGNRKHLQNASNESNEMECIKRQNVIVLCIVSYVIRHTSMDVCLVHCSMHHQTMYSMRKRPFNIVA